MAISPYAKVIRPGQFNRGRYVYGKKSGGPTRRRNYYNRYRGMSFVPRTMGALAVSESKYFDSFLSAAAISESTDWTGTELDPATLNTLFCPTEGADIDGRIGRRVEVYKIAIRGVIKTTALSAQGAMIPAASVRLILFIDEQTNATQAQGEQLMAAPGAATGPLTFSTFQNLANLGRFRVLRDKSYGPKIVESFNDAATTGTMTCSDQPFKMTVKFRKPVIIKFNATNGGTIADIVDNSFHLLGQKSSGGYASTMSYQVRTYYKDK